jgi:circadian clock protein KaiB
MTAGPELTVEQFERAVAALDQAHYELTLFVNGASERSAHAIADVRALCDAHLAGRFHLNVVDVHQNPDLVARFRVLASPTLVKEKPLPVRMLVGDLSDEGRVLAALDIRPVGGIERSG